MTEPDPIRDQKVQMRVSPGILTEVVDGGYCIGCGGCASVTPKIRMRFDDHGMYKPQAMGTLDAAELSATARICPSLIGGNAEDDLARARYGGSAAHDPVVGYHLGNHAGYVSEGTYREKGSSGGFGTWLPVQLLEQGFVDAIIHVKEVEGPPGREKFFAYEISTDAAEVRLGAKSRYYPIEISSVIERVRNEPGRYAFVGLPCFIKTIRLLQKNDAVLAERIPYCIGVVCGHLKSKRYGEFLAWQAGVSPEELLSLDFRHKEPGNRAKGYVLRATGTKDGKLFEVKRPVSEVFGSNWGLGFFKNNACDFCDDVFAECADVALGDAWLPEYEKDREGTSLLVVRSKTILRILNEARSSGRIQLDDIPIHRAIESQAAGVRHRREGLAYRLFLKMKKGKWVPEKRVKPSAAIPIEGKLKYRMRVKLLEESHHAYSQARAAGNLGIFKSRLAPTVAAYSAIIAMARMKSKLANLIRFSRK